MEYEYGCLMLSFNINDKSWNDFTKKLINLDDLYEPAGYGIETEPHCTILYGLHHDKFNLLDVVPFLKKINNVKVYSNNIGSFKNSEYDVLKFDLFGDDLMKMNQFVTNNFEFTSDFPEYKPHATIAYMKPGLSDKYTRQLSKPYVLKAKNYIYSSPEGHKTYFKV